MGDADKMMKFEANKKSIFVAYLLWWFFGTLGAHRFYFGRKGTAIAMLLITLISIPLMFVFVGFIPFAVVVVWAIIDAFLIPGICREYNNSLAEHLSSVGIPAPISA